MSLNNHITKILKPTLSNKGNEIVTRLETLYIEGKITQDDLLLIAEHLLNFGNYFSRKQYAEFTGKSSKAHYFQPQYKFLDEFFLIKIC